MEYIPVGLKPLDGSEAKPFPRLRAATRNGSKLEFDDKLQFLSFLHLEAEKARKKELNALVKDLEELKEVVQERDLEPYLEEKSKKFLELSLNERLNLLFVSPVGASIISRMFNNSLDLLEVSDVRLKYKKGS